MAKKASDHYKVYHNPNGPDISTVSRRVLSQDGLVFKDIDGSGEVSAVNDWRLPAAERAAAYVKVLTLDEKIGQLFISDWRMGAKYPCPVPDHVVIPDESGVLDDAEVHGKTIFGEQHLCGTTTLLKEWFARHLILRANPTPDDLADWLNQLQAVAEECAHFVPVSVASNSRNENGEVVFGMNDASGVFATWPGTMGIAAAVKGARIDIVDKFADCIRREWNACGLRKGYMYMADCMTDPRWQRTFGTFGEDPALICEIMEHLIPRVQGSREGVTADGVAVTTKHFPGGGARENGFDPHYAAGQWNVYATEGSLQKYHIPAFRVAVDCNTSSIMPYYSKPAAAKSASQKDCEGNVLDLKPYGFAYNRYFIDTILRGQLGFKGYINSDTGIVHNMCWGGDMLDKPERIG
ncbi:MAG: glycoside hydrolase family 3 N-terminal domain-containing protein, partial [Gemmiger sp.]